MTRSTRLALSLAVAAGLAIPTVAGAQTAVPRPAGSSAGSGSSSGSSGSETSPPGPPIVRPSDDGQRRAPTGSRTTGSATSRGTASGRASSGSGAPSTRGGGGGATAGDGRVTRIGRDRDGRTTRGTAVSRPPSSPVVYLPIFRWSSWYPYYGGYYGGYYGNRFGLGWSPYGWSSFYWPYDPYWDPYYDGGGRYDRDEYEESERRTGSIRLRAKPADASVYINGALVGKIDDFDGLTDHLELEGGVHQIEIRMDGYETYRGEITVEIGKTLTERLSLKKIK